MRIKERISLYEWRGAALEFDAAGTLFVCCVNGHGLIPIDYLRCSALGGFRECPLKYVKNRQILPARIKPVRDETIGPHENRTDTVALSPRQKLRIAAFELYAPVPGAGAIQAYEARFKTVENIEIALRQEESRIHADAQRHPMVIGLEAVQTHGLTVQCDGGLGEHQAYYRVLAGSRQQAAGD